MGMARPSSGGGARRGRTPARRARAHLPAAPRRSRGSRAPPPRPPGAPRPAPAPPGGGPSLRRRPSPPVSGRPPKCARGAPTQRSSLKAWGVPLPLRVLRPVGWTPALARGTSKGRGTLCFHPRCQSPWP
ncbi:CASP-like protein 4A1 [Cervus canadensis]|uniref:CASP-like protein 4A1 n=1 Tax=Cervus canadensis TaxID=1574408 RepID=UPI001C9E340A|nr:CASP-like protein 4A1 [Cervus canadensis]